MQWFRFYTEALNDPKVQSLDGTLFKAWVNLLCVTSQCDGVIRFGDVSFFLRMSDKDAMDACKELVDKSLLDIVDDGYVPHGWEKRQFKSDTSTERTKRHREKSREQDCDVPVTAPETEQNRAETEQNRMIGDAPAEAVAEIPPKIKTEKGKSLQNFMEATFGKLEIPQEWGEWAYATGLTAEEIDFTWDEFLDYWRGVPGAKGRKTDWEATFRNRVRIKIGDKKRKGELNELYAKKRSKF